VTKNFTFKSPPRGPVYVEMLQAGLEDGATLLLVVQPSLPLGGNGSTLLASLDEYALDARDASEWPGTRLLSGTARVHRFKLGPELVNKLLKATESLLDWQQPNLPEDLCILRADGTPWLTTISHEGDAFLSLTSDEAEKLRTAHPAVMEWITPDEEENAASRNR